jgi:hypothetical protein
VVAEITKRGPLESARRPSCFQQDASRNPRLCLFKSGYGAGKSCGNVAALGKRVTLTGLLDHASFHGTHFEGIHVPAPKAAVDLYGLLWEQPIVRRMVPDPAAGIIRPSSACNRSPLKAPGRLSAGRNALRLSRFLEAIALQWTPCRIILTLVRGDGEHR